MSPHLLPLLVAIPLGSAFLLPLAGKKRDWFADLWANLAAFSLCALSFVALAGLMKGPGPVVYRMGGWPPPLGITLILDPLTAFMLVTVNLLAFLATLYSVSYMRRYTEKWNFYTLFLLMLAGMNGVIITADLFNLFVFLEIASVASYALVAFGTEHEELEAAFKYTVMGSLAGAFILLGIGLLYGYTSTLNLADIGRVLAERAGPGGDSRILLFVTVLFLVGFGLKAALVPFHAWLPDAHPSAPAPISAMLSGVLIKALGIYALARILFNVFGINPKLLAVLMFLGALSMMVGVLLAVGQWDMKRLLAYHSISQVGYVMLGIGLGTPLGILGGLFHLFNHSVFKSLLFLTSGAVEYATGTRDLRRMGGLRERMPCTAGASLAASLSIAGIPPFNGFWSKLIIILACVQAGRTGYAFWAVLGSILTLASFMKLQKYAFFGKLNEKYREVKEVPLTMRFAMVVLALVCLAGGLLLVPALVQYFLGPAAGVLEAGKEYVNVVLGSVK